MDKWLFTYRLIRFSFRWCSVLASCWGAGTELNTESLSYEVPISQHLLVALICIFLITDDEVEHFFMFSSHFVFLYCELCIHLLCQFFSSCLFLIDCQEFLAFSLNVSSLLTLRVSEILFPSFPCYFYSLLIVSFDKQRFFLFMSINLYIFSLKLVIFPSCVRNLFSQYHEDILLYHQLEFFVFCFLHLCLQSTWN